ncbi:MAG: DUF1080 domain-containing protein [Opitutaceae bacterium]|nr:DUF1080 domain-containing protein [Opitutaceae bacterium]
MNLPLIRKTPCSLKSLAIASIGIAFPLSLNAQVSNDYTEWDTYRGDQKGNQYAELAQVHAANVHKLELAWQYRTGDANERSSIQVNPIVVDGLLYMSTPTLRAVALDAVTGEKVWVFKSEEYNENQTLFRGRTRGVTYWESDDGSDRRIFLFVKHRVYALNAKTGELIRSFGEDGHIDLRYNLGIDPERASVECTSPGSVYKNYLIAVGRVPEGYDSTPGHIRAYDTVTGEFKWIFRTIPEEGEFGYDTWEFVKGERYGGANSWGGITIDEKRGWVFASTGSPSYDFYGGFRKGDNLFGNCVLALNAETGERIWHYQTVHHDLWDYDNPPAPVLVTIGSGENAKDAVVQLTKMGLTFVLDRDTGKPLFPTPEIPVPSSKIAGEYTSSTQPIPLKPAPLGRLGISEADLTNISPEARAHALKEFARYDSGTLYTPPSERGVITSPGLFGGVEWHGASFDPYQSILYVNSNDSPTISRLRKIHEPANSANISEIDRGRVLYAKNCTTCHGIDRQGIPPLFPSVANLNKTEQEIVAIIRDGGNIMPAFPHFAKDEIAALAAYMASPETEAAEVSDQEMKTRYLAEGYHLFTDHQGYPAISPPWGTLNAIDLKTGEFAWRIPLGEYPELAKQGIRNTGTLNYGGAVATAGGLVFIAATADEKIRAFEKTRGKLLWEYQLPAGGYATPSVYMVDGKQYLTIVAGGGGKNRTKSGDYVLTFALPNATETVEDYASMTADEEGWISLFDGETLEGWTHMNGSHTYTVEDGAIIGRTVEGSQNSFLCSLAEFGDFEFECETMVDDITNQGIQFRSSVRPVTERDHPAWRAGRVWGPQLEIRRNMGPGKITTGVLYGEALGTGWLSSEEKKADSHDYFISEGWNKVRIVANGPRMQTYVNGHLIEDITREDVYETHPTGFIALQIHGIKGEREFTMAWRSLKIRPLE